MHSAENILGITHDYICFSQHEITLISIIIFHLISHMLHAKRNKTVNQHFLLSEQFFAQFTSSLHFFFFLVFVSKAYFVISGSQTGVGVIASHSTDEKIEAVYPQSEEASYSPYQHWTLSFVRCTGPRLFLSNTGSLESLQFYE